MKNIIPHGIGLPKRKIKSRCFVFAFLAVIVLYVGAVTQLIGQTVAAEHAALEYDVQVNAHIVPIFAIDKKGNPVYDLKEDDIELYVNNKRYDVLSFSRYAVGETVQSAATVLQAPAAQPVPKQHSERIIFIILDGMNNTMEGVRNGKRIACGIVKNGKPGDAFIILTANVHRGFKYVIGPEKNKNLLLNSIEKIYQDPRWVSLRPHRNVAPLAGMGMRRDNGGVEFNATISRIGVKMGVGEHRQFIGILTRFSYSLRDLKYALKTIRWPKMIFLVSGGVKEIAGNGIFSMRGYTYKYYELLKESAIGINRGGALLYMINPIFIHRHEKGVRNAVNHMTKIGNAKCIAGENIEEVLTKVAKNTAAYYEVAFMLNAKMKDRFKIKLKCKREGIRLNTLRYGEKAKKYTDMEDVQKKLFALNVVTGGSWSRVMGKIGPAKLTDISPDTGKKKNKIKVEIAIPEELQNKKLDIFVLQVNQDTLKADIKMKQETVGATSTVDVKIKSGERQFIVLVEPKKAQCFYNMVRRD